MTYQYERLPDPGAGLRLHLNENTGGCSPRVLDAIRRLDSAQISVYPDYTATVSACAAHLGVPPDWLLLTNGLDEGILAVSLVALARAQRPARAVIIEPAFDMYAACTGAAGGDIVRVAPAEGFTFPLAGLLEAITPETRLLFLASPNNPTGQAIDAATLQTVLDALPAGVLLFLDEAYAGFGAPSFVGQLADWSNLVIGRTFAKGYGLAGLRVGCLAAIPETLEPLRGVVPPYSINVCAAVGLAAALDDRRYVEDYAAQVAESRRLIYEMCGRLQLEHWPSAANFVLVRIGDRAAALVTALGRRGIFVRDRSREPGCAGCVRVTAGIVEHTKACVAAIEEVLCEPR